MIESRNHVLRRLQARHWLLVGLSVALAWWAGTPGAGGILLGGGLIGSSVLVYATGLGLLVRRTRPILAIALLFAKLALLLAVGWWAFAANPTMRRPDPMGFALGVTCFPLAAVWEATRGQKRAWSITHSPGSGR